METLSVGMYVRFDGIIRQIIDIDEDDYIEFDEEFADHFGYVIFSEKKETFIKVYKPKASFDIIDLIHSGDYVNGEVVMRVFNPVFLSKGELPYVITTNNKYEESEIFSILTEEFVAQMKYILSHKEEEYGKEIK